MRVLLLCLMMCLALNTTAGDKETVCVRQYGLRGWDRPSTYEATVTRGLELNKATRSSRYEPLATYVVIFYDTDRVHVLELGLPNLMRVDQAAKDEYGRQWKVSNARSCV